MGRSLWLLVAVIVAAADMGLQLAHNAIGLGLGLPVVIGIGGIVAYVWTVAGVAAYAVAAAAEIFGLAVGYALSAQWLLVFILVLVAGVAAATTLLPKMKGAAK